MIFLVNMLQIESVIAGKICYVWIVLCSSQENKKLLLTRSNTRQEYQGTTTTTPKEAFSKSTVLKHTENTGSNANNILKNKAEDTAEKERKSTRSTETILRNRVQDTAQEEIKCAEKPRIKSQDMTMEGTRIAGNIISKLRNRSQDDSREKAKHSNFRSDDPQGVKERETNSSAKSNILTSKPQETMTAEVTNQAGKTIKILISRKRFQDTAEKEMKPAEEIASHYNPSRANKPQNMMSVVVEKLPNVSVRKPVTLTPPVTIASSFVKLGRDVVKSMKREAENGLDKSPPLKKQGGIMLSVMTNDKQGVGGVNGVQNTYHSGAVVRRSSRRLRDSEDSGSNGEDLPEPLKKVPVSRV